MRVGFDLDGVLADIVGQLRIFAREKFCISFRKYDVTSENAEECTPLSRDQLVQLFSTPDFFKRMLPVAGARHALESLRLAGASIHIVTDRFWYTGLHEDTETWLKEMNLLHDSLHFSRKTEKQLLVAQLSLDSFVEDQRSNANLLAEKCPVLLLDRPYNQGPIAPNVSRVKSLRAALNTLQRFRGILPGFRASGHKTSRTNGTGGT